MLAGAPLESRRLKHLSSSGEADQRAALDKRVAERRIGCLFVHDGYRGREEEAAVRQLDGELSVIVPDGADRALPCRRPVRTRAPPLAPVPL